MIASSISPLFSSCLEREREEEKKNEIISSPMTFLYQMIGLKDFNYLVSKVFNTHHSRRIIENKVSSNL